jgi:hypothetical protein
MCNAVTPENEIRANGTDEPIRLANAMPIAMPRNLLTIPCASPFAITWNLTLIDFSKYDKNTGSINFAYNGCHLALQ